MLSNLRLSLRTLAASRGFAFIAVLTLAVGIGASTAIFSALQALVIKPYSYPAADRLVHVWSGSNWPLSPADSVDVRKDSSSYVAFGVYQPQSYNVGQENAQAVSGVSGTSDVLKAFGVRPELGRYFEPADEAIGAAPPRPRDASAPRRRPAPPCPPSPRTNPRATAAARSDGRLPAAAAVCVVGAPRDGELACYRRSSAPTCRGDRSGFSGRIARP
jgi:hypothetical protein